MADYSLKTYTAAPANPPQTRLSHRTLQVAPENSTSDQDFQLQGMKFVNKSILGIDKLKFWCIFD